jgi:hypothetical protein
VTGDIPHRPPFSCAIGMGLAYESGSSLQEQILTREVHHRLSPDPNFDFRGSTSNFRHIPSPSFKPHFTLYLTSSSHDVHSNREHASHRPRSYCKVHPGFLFFEQFSSPSMPRAKRQPLGAVKSGVRKADLPPKPVVSAALRTAIDTTVEPRYNDTNFSAISLRYTEVSFNQGSRAHIINKEGPP